MPEEEDTNGNDTRLVDLYPEDSRSLVLDPDGPGGKRYPTLIIPESAVTLSFGILSLGAVASLLYFVHLCFLHPDTANLLIPVLLTWAAPKLAEAWKQHKDRIKEKTK